MHKYFINVQKPVYTHANTCIKSLVCSFPDCYPFCFIFTQHIHIFSAPAFVTSNSTMSEKGNKKAPAAGIPKYMKFTIGGLAGLVFIKTSIHKKRVYMMHV